jgi:uncharacterized membrane protein
MLVWKALHIISMFTMVAGFIGVEVFYAAAIRRRDVRAAAFVQRTLEKTGFGPLAFVALLAGIVFGLLTAATGGFDFTQGWLVGAYVLLGFFVVNAVIAGNPVVKAGKASIEAEEGRGSIEEVAASLPVGRATYIVLANAATFTAIVLLMVLKPF